jgi:hypothetical protein
MAKLSARGRTTLAAVIKEWKNPQLPRLSQEGDSYMVEYEWQTVKRRFMSDGNVLEWVKWKHHKHAEPFIQNWKLMRKYPTTEKDNWLAVKLKNGWKEDTKA